MWAEVQNNDIEKYISMATSENNYFFENILE